MGTDDICWEGFSAWTGRSTSKTNEDPLGEHEQGSLCQSACRKNPVHIDHIEGYFFC